MFNVAFLRSFLVPSLLASLLYTLTYLLILTYILIQVADNRKWRLVKKSLRGDREYTNYVMLATFLVTFLVSPFITTNFCHNLL